MYIFLLIIRKKLKGGPPKKGASGHRGYDLSEFYEGGLEKEGFFKTV